MNGHTSVMDLPLPHRVRSALYRADIETLNQLLSCSEYHLLRVRGFGRWARTHVRRFLRGSGLELGQLLPVSKCRAVSDDRLKAIVTNWEALNIQSPAPDNVCMASELLGFRRVLKCQHS